MDHVISGLAENFILGGIIDDIKIGIKNAALYSPSPHRLSILILSLLFHISELGHISPRDNKVVNDKWFARQGIPPPIRATVIIPPEQHNTPFTQGTPSAAFNGPIY